MHHVTEKEATFIAGFVFGIRTCLAEIANLQGQIKDKYDAISAERQKNVRNVITDEIAELTKQVEALYTKKSVVEAKLFEQRRSLKELIEG